MEKFSFTKHTSSGSESVARRLENRDDRGIFNEVQRYFGYRIICILNNRKERDPLIKMLNKINPKVYAQTEQQLKKIATKEPEAVEQMLFEYFSMTDTEKALALFDLDSNPEDDFEFLEQSGAINSRSSSNERMAGRRILVAKEKSEFFLDCLREDSVYSLSERVFTNKQFGILIKHHYQMIQQKEKTFLEYFEKSRERLRCQVHRAIDEGIIPLEKSVFDERFNAVSVRCIDPLLANFEDIWGNYDGTNYYINISLAVPPEQFESTLIHELMHLGAGEHDITEVYSDDECGYEDRRNMTLRSGFHFEQTGDKLLKKHPLDFQWLNEATTEMITLDILNKETGSYAEYRAFVQTLLEMGLSKEVLYRAYFENYDLARVGHRVPSLQNLFKETNRLFGNGFLVNVDQYLQKQAEMYSGLGKRALSHAVKDLHAVALLGIDVLRVTLES